MIAKRCSADRSGMCRRVIVDSGLEQQMTRCAAISLRTDQFQKLTSVITMDHL